MNRYQRHVCQLLQDNHIKVLPIEDISKSAGSFERKMVLLKYPQTFCEYAICLHEIGHVLNTPMVNKQNRELRLRNENIAWDWAKKNALIWNKEMQVAYDFGIKSHKGELDYDDELNYYNWIISRPSFEYNP